MNVTNGNSEEEEENSDYFNLLDMLKMVHAANCTNSSSEDEDEDDEQVKLQVVGKRGRAKSVAVAEAESLPKEGNSNRRRSSVLNLLLGKKDKSSLSLNAQIVQVEKQIAKKLKALDKLHARLQTLKNIHTK